MDALAVADGLCHRFHRRAALAERLDDRKAARIFDDRAGHIAVRLRLHGRVDAAVMRNDEHEAERQRRRGKRDERRDRTAHGKADEDDEEI